MSTHFTEEQKIQIKLRRIEQLTYQSQIARMQACAVLAQIELAGMMSEDDFLAYFYQDGEVE